MEQDVTRYLPGMNRLRYQGLIYFAKTMRNLQTLLIKIYRLSNLKLRCLQINMWTWMVCIFPSLLRLKSTANATNIDGNMITLSNFFVHWIREIGKSANKIRCENNMYSGNKNEWTFWVNKQVSALSTTESDAQIIYRTTPYFQHEQIKLNGLYKQFLETAFWLRKNAFKTGLQKLLLKKSYELVLSLQFYATNFVLQIDN